MVVRPAPDAAATALLDPPAAVRAVAARSARPLAVAGTIGVGASVVLFGVLHVVAAELAPTRHMISDYALGLHRPLFDGGVLAMAVGSAAVLAALVRGRVVRVPSGAAALLVSWCVSLALVAAFPTCGCQLPHSFGGSVHALASTVGFVSLPVAALLLGREWRDHPGWARQAARARLLGLSCAAALVPLVGCLLAVPLAGPVLGAQLWEAVPLGLLQRALAVVEVGVLVVLGTWALRATASAGALDT